MSGDLVSDEVLTLPIATLAADPDNPRQISDEALAGLGVSVKEFGDLSGIVWNERTGQLVAGHQRVTALRAAGATTWQRDSGSEDRAWLVHPTTAARFPIRIVDWEPTRQRMANLVANNTAIAGTFTPAAAEQLEALEQEAAFESLRLGEMQKQVALEMAALAEPPPKEGNTDPDHVPDEVEAVTKPGDLWILGEHRLLCGDSTKPEDIARLLGGARPALGLHDPPYGINVQHKDGRIGGGGKVYPHIIGDDRPFDPAHLLESAEVVVLWGANHYADKLPPKAGWLVWVKRPDMPQNDFSDAELAWCSAGGHVRVFSYVWSGLVRAGKTEEGPVRVHPTQKPIALYAWVLEQLTKPGDIVYDGYAGSGPAVLACERHGRQARVIEMLPAYCDLIVTRWERYTSRKAVRADSNSG